jgi:serine protease Do
MGVLDELSSAVAQAADRVGPSVVGLGRGWGRGSGFVLADGLVATNAHNLRSEQVTVAFADGRRESGSVAGAAVDADVAVIRVETGDAPPLEWAHGAAPGVAIGTAVFALANPGGRGLHATLGFVSAVGRSFRGPRGRRIRGSVEHTAPLPRGSSGAPLVDSGGRLIGINTVRMDGGLILALPADDALRRLVDALATGDTPHRPKLGIALAPPHVARKLRHAVGLPERDGLLVRGVEPGSPAARAGIERGDLIVAAGDAGLTRFDDIHAAIDAGTDELTLTVVRGIDERVVKADMAGADQEAA